LFTKGQDLPTAINALRRSLESDTALARKVMAAGEGALSQLKEFYKESGSLLYQASQQALGLKLVLGGTKTLLNPQVRAVRSMALYADMIAIPDPIFRWLDVGTEYKRMWLLRMLEELQHVLTLRPAAGKKQDGQASDADRSGRRDH